MASDDTTSVGFLMRMAGTTATARMLKAFRSVAYEHGWHLHVLRYWNADDTPEDLIRNWGLDAAFIQGELYGELDPAIWGHRPVVVFSPPFPSADAPGVSTVSFDDRAVGAAAAAHLLGRGLQSFAAVLQGRPPFAMERFAGFQEALGGRPVVCWDDALAKSRHYTDPGDRSGLRRWLRSLPRPCGLFAPCDAWGVWVLEWCMSAGVQVPEDLAVLGVDGDDNLCDYAVTPLSSIDLPWEQLARTAAGQLANMLGSQCDSARCSAPPLRPGEVIMRRSTDLIATDDRDVREALSMIGAKALGPLRPADVIAHLGASRNKLRKDFHRVVGRTLSEEIRRVRIEEAKRILYHSDLSVDGIARRCGFATTALLNSAFVQVVGTTPGAFRRRQRLHTRRAGQSL